MLSTFKSGVVKNLTVEITVNDKVAQVNVTDDQANTYVQLDEQSSISISVNRKTGKINVNQNNVDSVAAGNTLATTVIAKINAVIAEVDAL